MKASAKRRRSKAQILEDKQKALAREQEIQDKLQAWDQLTAALHDSEMKRQKLEQDHQHVQVMFDDGLIKVGDDGSYQAVRDESEQSQIKAEVQETKRKKAMTAEQASRLSAQLDEQSVASSLQ